MQISRLQAFLLPAFGTVLAILFLGEAFAGYHAAGIGVILAGVLIATRATSTWKKRSARGWNW